jgi:hypothetical protein
VVTGDDSERNYHGGIFRILSHNLNAETDENYRRPQSVKPAFLSTS